MKPVAQIAGYGLSIGKAILQDAVERRSRLRNLLLGYVHASANQIAQTAACNRLHFLEQRCSRWLLIAHDSARGDTFSVTQEFLAMMLGVHRPGISLALKRLQDMGMVKYVRGRITIVDRQGIESTACECYREIHEVFERLFRGTHGV
jgi:CRP-like cAMP-binding protein